MVKFRNIRVKMRGGGSRIQRAMVLASGKLKFVKNLSRSRASSSRQFKPKTKRSVRNTTKKKNSRSGGGGIMRTAEKIGQLGAFAAPHVDAFILKKDTNLGVYRLTGYHMATQKWHWEGLAEGWGPGVAFTLAAKAFHKLNAILRRL